MDWQGPVPNHENDDEVVVVPDTPSPLSRADMDELEILLAMSHSSANYGIDVYESVLHFVSCRVCSTV